MDGCAGRRGGGGSRKTAGECHGLLAVQFSERPPRRRHPAARSGNMPITWSSHRRLPPYTCPPCLRVVQLFRSLRKKFGTVLK